MGITMLGQGASIQTAGTSGAGHHMEYLLGPSSTGGMAVQSWTLSEEQSDDNKTSVSDTAMRFGATRRSWTCDFQGRFPRTTRKLGSRLLATVGSGTLDVYKLYSFSMSIDWGEVECTPADMTAIVASLGSTSYNYLMYKPHVFPRVSGSFSCYVDNANVDSPLFSEGDTVPSVTWRISDEATDNTVAFSLVTLSRNHSVDIATGDKQVRSFNFVADGGITFAGTNPLLASGALAAQVVGDSSDIPTEILEVVAGTASAGSKRFTGMAYLRSLQVSLEAAGIISVSASCRGTGPLVISHS